jgi:hypothetical protein
MTKMATQQGGFSDDSHLLLMTGRSVLPARQYIINLNRNGTLMRYFLLLTGSIALLSPCVG